MDDFVSANKHQNETVNCYQRASTTSSNTSLSTQTQARSYFTRNLPRKLA